MKKMAYVFILFGLLNTSLSFATSCPSVAEIKKSQLQGWQAYDSDDGIRLSAAREKAFKKNIQEFALAEWVSGGKQHGTIHCYYRDQTGSALEAYLAKQNFIPTDTKHYWYKVSGFMQCAAGQKNCLFESKTQLATK